MGSQRRKLSVRGQVLVILTIALMTMIGFLTLTVELGRLGVAKEQAAKQADLAALAAGVRLPNQTTGAPAARTVATENGADAVTVSYPTSRSVAVTCTENFSYFFAGIWRFRSAQLRKRTTVAQTNPIASISDWLRPIAVNADAYDLTQTLTLKLTALSKKSDFKNDSFVALCLGDNSLNTYTGNLQDGYAGTVQVGDIVDTGPGPGGPGKGKKKRSWPLTTIAEANVTGIQNDPATGESLFQRAVLSPYNDNGGTYTYPDYPYGDPRIMPVALATGSASSKVEVLGFGAFYVQNLTGGGQNLQGRFLEYSIGTGRAGGAATDYGLRSYQLQD